MKNIFSEDAPDAQGVLNQIILEHLKEQKRKRWVRWIYRIGFLLVLLVLVYRFQVTTDDEIALRNKAHVGLIDIEGGIFDMEAANADYFMRGLDSAYKSKGLKAMIFRINSPGGSPVQADYMYNAIKDYRQKYPQIKTYAVCVDICASAAYYIASAADDIYANPASLVGSIGVLYNGFGFVDGMKKIGVSRRLQTAGIHKGMLDPFSPETPEDKAYLQSVLDTVHQQFIQKVKEGRGDRLVQNSTIFTGIFWSGQQALPLGLIDGFASAGQLVKQTIKVNQVIDYTYKQSVMERLSKGLTTYFENPLSNRWLGRNFDLSL